MKHRRVSNKKMKQIMADIGMTDKPEDDDSQLLLEQREQSVNEDKQIIKLDSENKQQTQLTPSQESIDSVGAFFMNEIKM